MMASGRLLSYRGKRFLGGLPISLREGGEALREERHTALVVFGQGANHVRIEAPGLGDVGSAHHGAVRPGPAGSAPLRVLLHRRESLAGVPVAAHLKIGILQPEERVVVVV